MFDKRSRIPPIPKTEPPRPKTGHSNLYESHPVRKRHPEFHGPTDAVEAIALPNMLAQDAEEGVLDLDMPCEPFADTKCYLLDGFSRVLTGDSYTPSVDGGAWSAGQKYQAYETDGSAFSFTASNYMGVWSTLGSAAYGWTTNPGLGCTGLDFTFTGWLRRETWQVFTVPAYPTDVAGLTLGTYTFTAPTGIRGGTVGQLEGASLVVLSSAPSGMGQGTVVAHLPSGVATTAFIPASLLPAEGGTLYVGVVPNWSANYGGYTCGWAWPWMDGQGHSAKGYYDSSLTATWQSWAVSADDWGAAASDDDTGAWWEGNLPWAVAASGGAYGYDGDSLYLTVAAGGQETLTATMKGTSTADIADDNDAAMGEPWSAENGVAMKVRFKLTTAGSVSEAGSRYLRFRWHDGRDVLTCVVRLGDMEYGQGLVVYDGDGYDADNYVAKDITEGTWMWLELDSRNPAYLKARMWAEGGMYGSGMPVKHDIVVERNDGAESPSRDDYFEISISAGNMTGADQTVAVDAVYFCGSGADCDWVQEYMGQGDGSTFLFETAQAFKPDSLWWFVDGLHTRIESVDAERGQFRSPLSIPAAIGANIVARYRVDLNPAGD